MVEQEPCVLIVDDEQSDLERIKKALASIRLRVLTISDPHEVLRKVESELPDLVMMDALLPGLSGFDLCKQIKTELEVKNTLVVILTGVYLKDHYRREAIHQFKADGFVTKPFRDRELQRLVLKLLAKKLQTSPKEMQESLTHAHDILLESELEEKPSWFGRIFGRLKGTPAQPAQTGFLRTATEDRVAEEQPEPQDETVPVVEMEEGEREDEIVEEATEAEVEAEPEKVPVKEEGEVKETAEPESPQQEVTSEGAAEDERGEKREAAAEIEEVESVDLAEVAAVEEETGIEPQELEGVPAESESLPTSDSGIVDIGSAKAVFEALGNGRDTELKTEIPEEDAVVEEVEESLTEKTMPAAAAFRETGDEVVEKSRDTEEAEAAQAEARTSPPRPRALHEELPIYQEEDYLHELKREVSMCDRLGRSITLIMVRIVDLDQIVELLGRQFRSKVLFHVAEHAVESLREIDMVGLLESKELIALTAFASDRYGGDKIVSRLQTLLGHNPFEVDVGLPSFIPDLRFGMAVYPGEAAGMEEMIERAEAELAAARRPD